MAKHTRTSSTLILTQIIFRHGHRSPDQAINYPGDPHQHETYMPFGKGELTLKGRKQCFAFGKQLRTLYNTHLGEEYHHNLIDARSSEVSRARTTLQLVLAGLFPPTPTTTIEDTLNWQPIPFTYVPLKQDALIGVAITNMYNHRDHPDFRRTANSRTVVECIERNLQWRVKHHAQCLLLYDTLRTQIDNGLAMPEWCQEIYPDRLRVEFEEFVGHNFGRKEFLVGGIGAFLQHIVNVMLKKQGETELQKENKEEGRCKSLNQPKMHLYSGHDVNLAGLLSVFGCFKPKQWPLFMANMTFELHCIQGEFYVKLFYQDGPKDVVNESKRRVIWDMCALKEFIQHTEQYFPVES